ncbi:MAG: hypothetical protein ACM36C_16300 [Acidobacteriota bacterium]
MGLTRRELLTNGVIGGAALGGLPAGEAAPDAPEEREINQTLKSLVSEIQHPRHSMLPGDTAYVTRLREQMLEFMKGTNKWPDFIDVGQSPWFAIYDWHVRFRLQPAVVRLPDNRYGITFMFTTLVLRPEQTPSYIGLGYDKERLG